MLSRAWRWFFVLVMAPMGLGLWGLELLNATENGERLCSGSVIMIHLLGVALIVRDLSRPTAEKSNK